MINSMKFNIGLFISLNMN